MPVNLRDPPPAHTHQHHLPSNPHPYTPTDPHTPPPTKPHHAPRPPPPAPHHFPYYLLPLISGFMWFAQLWVLLIVWLASGRPHYTSMSAHQSIAYISDIGADVLRPLFIAGCCITAVFFVAALACMRRNHALVRRLERRTDNLAVACAGVGGVGLICLAALDTLRHPAEHRIFLAVFMAGVCLSALFTVVQYRRLGKTYRERRVIYWSYRVKEAVFVVEIALSVAFGVLMKKKKHDAAAVVEWTISFVFTLYVLSFFFDLRPRARTREIGGVRKVVGMEDRAPDEGSDEGVEMGVVR